MSNQEWLEWTVQHKTMFALRTDADAEMVAAWRDMLGHLHLVDLQAASQELLKNGGAPYSRHVNYLLAFVRNRARQAERMRIKSTCPCDSCRHRNNQVPALPAGFSFVREAAKREKQGVKP